MTVGECISTYRYNDKVKRIWLCPDVVRKPKLGNNYTCTISIESTPKADVLDCKVKKYWIEEGVLCIIYLPEDEPVIFAQQA